MSLRGLRIHITGSAATSLDRDLLRSAHEFVRRFASQVIERGGGLVCGAGGEPLGEAGEPCIFDWTLLDVVARLPDPAPNWPKHLPNRFCVTASQRGLEKIPKSRADSWNACLKRTDFHLDLTPPGWRMAGVIREQQMRRGDALLVLGGGAGAEHLAELYLDDGKPVVPIHADLGALSHDGNGGGRYLHERALGDVDVLFRLRDGAGSAAGRLTALRLTSATDVNNLASQAAILIDDLRPPTAFYVRLVADDHEDFEKVERFFRDVVDQVVAEAGFTAHQVGHHKPQAAFMNVEIFEGLHRAGLVIVDLTGVRPNCMMELGYALARRRRVIISAQKHTKLPFDPDKLPTYPWDEGGTRDERIRGFRDWFDRHLDTPPLVE